MEKDEWWGVYNNALREWKERMKEAMEEWKERMKEAVKKGAASMPSIPNISMPPMPPIPSILPSRSNVVASRIGDEELRVIDMLVKTGLFNTRSEAVAYLVKEGIKARKDVVDKVSSALEEISRIRREVEEHVKKLRRELGLSDSEVLQEKEKEKDKEKERGGKIGACPKCKRSLEGMPLDIVICPYCGFRMRNDERS
jgi:Arc/MetJ-type ribon-helix-helix transcriptional regulator